MNYILSGTYNIGSKEVTYPNGQKGRSYFTKVKLPVALVDNPSKKEDYLLDENGNKKLEDVWVGVKWCKGTKKVVDDMTNYLNPNFKEFRFGDVFVEKGYLPFYVKQNYRVDELQQDGTTKKDVYPKLLVCEVTDVKLADSKNEKKESKEVQQPTETTKDDLPF